MKPEFENYDHLEPISSSYGYCGVFGTLVALQCLRLILIRFTTLASVTDQNKWKWQNIQISWWHSTITGIGSLYCFYNYPELSQDLVAFHNPLSYGLLAFSTGYFLSDFLDIVINGQRKAQWEIVVHHIAALAILLYNITVCRYIGYTNVALLAEVNSISLHLRKLMQIAGVSFRNPVYKMNSFLNLILFLPFRLGALTWITIGMFWHRERVSTVYFYLLGLTMFVLWIINVILLWRLIKTDILRKPREIENGKNSHYHISAAANACNGNSKRKNDKTL